MLSEIITKEYFSFANHFETWQEAIIAGCQPLVNAGVVDETYADQIIASINEYGAYIIIAPYIALPHSQENAAGVKKTAVAFMRVRDPVSFHPTDKSKDAQIFFTLASENHQEHLKNLTALAIALDNEDLILALRQAENKADLQAIAHRFSL